MLPCSDEPRLPAPAGRRDQPSGASCPAAKAESQRSRNRFVIASVSSKLRDLNDCADNAQMVMQQQIQGRWTSSPCSVPTWMSLPPDFLTLSFYAALQHGFHFTF